MSISKQEILLNQLSIEAQSSMKRANAAKAKYDFVKLMKLSDFGKWKGKFPKK